ICVVSNGGAAAVQVEAIDAGRAGIVAQIGIARKDVNFRRVLRERSRSERKQREQTHYDLRLHTASMRFGFCAGARASGATLHARAASGSEQGAAKTLSLV